MLNHVYIYNCLYIKTTQKLSTDLKSEKSLWKKAKRAQWRNSKQAKIVFFTRRQGEIKCVTKNK